MNLRILFFAALCCFLQVSFSQTPRFIDTQVQFEPSDRDHSGSVRVMKQMMDRHGIRQMLIVPPPFPAENAWSYDSEKVKAAIGKQTDRFAFLGGGGSLNVMVLQTPADQVTAEIKAKFRARAEAILAQGAIGFGEVTAEHLSLPVMKQEGLKHFHNVTTADHPLLLLLADIAAENDVPIDFHFDIFPATLPTPPNLRDGNPPELRENKIAFERLLRHNRKARFTWAHLGSDPGMQRTPALMKELLDAHPNLYSAFRIFFQGPAEMTPIDASGSLKPQWLELIQRYPDRFTVHTDTFYASTWPPRRGPKDGNEKIVNFLSQLSPALAGKLAYENAQRFYKLKLAD